MDMCQPSDLLYSFFAQTRVNNIAWTPRARLFKVTGKPEGKRKGKNRSNLVVTVATGNDSETSPG